MLEALLILVPVGPLDHVVVAVLAPADQNDGAPHILIDRLPENAGGRGIHVDVLDGSGDVLAEDALGLAVCEVVRLGRVRGRLARARVVVGRLVDDVVVRRGEADHVVASDAGGHAGVGAAAGAPARRARVYRVQVEHGVAQLRDDVGVSAVRVGRDAEEDDGEVLGVPVVVGKRPELLRIQRWRHLQDVVRRVDPVQRKIVQPYVVTIGVFYERATSKKDGEEWGWRGGRHCDEIGSRGGNRVSMPMCNQQTSV